MRVKTHAGHVEKMTAPPPPPPPPPFNFAESMASIRQVLSVCIAFAISIGMPRNRARPLPDPQGTIPKTVLEFTIAEATSFTVPSPPTATIISKTFTASLAICRACDTPSLKTITKLNAAVSRYCSISSGTPSFFFPPDIGFIINNAFLFN